MKAEKYATRRLQERPDKASLDVLSSVPAAFVSDVLKRMNVTRVTLHGIKPLYAEFTRRVVGPAVTMRMIPHTGARSYLDAPFRHTEIEEDQLPDPRYAIVHDFAEGIMGLGNDSGYENPTIAKIWRRALAEPDNAARLELMRQAEKIVIEDVPFVWLAKVVSISAVRREVNGDHAHTGYGSGYVQWFAAAGYTLHDIQVAVRNRARLPPRRVPRS